MNIKEFPIQYSHISQATPSGQVGPVKYRQLCQSQSGGTGKSCRNPKIPDLTLQRPRGPSSGQAGRHTPHLLLELNGAKTGTLPGQPLQVQEPGPRTKDPQGLRFSGPRDGVLRHLKSGDGGEHPSPRAAVGHTPGNMKTTCANKALSQED